jgi:hypothetical protein
VKLLAAMLLVALSCFGGDTTLSDDEIEKAIVLGKQYKNMDKLWDHEFEKTHTFKFSGISNKTGTKRVSVWTDYALVAMESAVAAHEMRDFSVAEARLLPSLGKLRAVVRIYGFALFYFSNAPEINDIFGFNRTHMVLDHEGTIIQPEKKVQIPGGVVFDTDFWKAVETDNTPKGAFLNGYLVYVFVYDLKEQRAGKFKFVLVGGDNKKFTIELDLATLR